MRYIMIEETVQVLLMQLAHFNLVGMNQKTVTGHSCDSILPFVHLPCEGGLSGIAVIANGGAGARQMTKCK